MKIIKDLFNLVITIQTMLFFLFLVENVNNLDTINYSFSIASYDYSFTLNIYSLLIIIAVVFTIILIFSLNIFGSGMNETGTSSIAKYVGFIILFLILNISTAYFLQYIWAIGSIIFLAIVIIYLMRILDSIMNNDNSMSN